MYHKKSEHLFKNGGSALSVPICSDLCVTVTRRYSQTCIERSPWRQRKNVLIRQMTS